VIETLPMVTPVVLSITGPVIVSPLTEPFIENASVSPVTTEMMSSVMNAIGAPPFLEYFVIVPELMDNLTLPGFPLGTVSVRLLVEIVEVVFVAVQDESVPDAVIEVAPAVSPLPSVARCRGVTAREVTSDKWQVTSKNKRKIPTFLLS
jgi:hypothetical protein